MVVHVVASRDLVGRVVTSYDLVVRVVARRDLVNPLKQTIRTGISNF